ncbi:membrane protein insertion efficiency factor YidD [Undibacterium sp. 5I1]|uniref:membrane protein insertion efficiency factor YidD n=1 Tax=unclassified Undibacterium TaxID=2630295 RepID=UPI002AB48F4C|nr:MULTISPECIES: membrane protein insertion efficiency factor YidD [unclassified Undibacterium]MDY7539650.1 membrane protein insertion efficiency factor YidD [Undibacterium sp. 5I1]MEB0232229.1 membrane protein insertion efficiency factor YidD [Undibacterium sp. 10I3]MEB0257426.1 membrane protein insertion efficiency factor YidD [Undibacterium sp. 5I1]
MKPLLLLLLRFYKLAISPMLGQNCRFYPSCSDYAAEAIREHGAAKGCLLAGKRVCKCHPWHPGGVDPVPQKSEKNSFVPTSDGRSKKRQAAYAKNATHATKHHNMMALKKRPDSSSKSTC